MGNKQSNKFQQISSPNTNHSLGYKLYYQIITSQKNIPPKFVVQTVVTSY